MNARDQRNLDPLSLAVMFNAEAKVVRALLEAHGGSPNSRSESGSTLLHLATAANNSPDVVRLLVDVGGDANAVDERNRTPLHIAASTAKSVTRVNPLTNLLTLGIAKGIWDVGGSFSERSWRSNAMNNVELLLDSGADPNAVDTSGQARARKELRSMNNVELLLDSGADPNAVDTSGQTPLHAAAARRISPDCRTPTRRRR